MYVGGVPRVALVRVAARVPSRVLALGRVRSRVPEAGYPPMCGGSAAPAAGRPHRDLRISRPPRSLLGVQ